MGKRKVVSMKKRFRPQSSLAFFLLLLIVIYIIVLAWGYQNVEITRADGTSRAGDLVCALRGEERMRDGTKTG